MNSRAMEHRNGRTIIRFLALCFGILLARAFQLQVVQGSGYRDWSERNRVRQVPVPASRGRIYDRYGQILTDNRPSFCLYAVPQVLTTYNHDTSAVASILGLPFGEIVRRTLDAQTSPFHPVRVLRDVDFETLTRVEESRADLPGLFFQVEPVRTYPSPVRATHALGYCGEAGKDNLAVLEGRRVNPGEMVGKTGVEARYDGFLRGRDGFRYVEVDVRGREVGDFSGRRDVEPEPGRDVMLTIDLEIQQVAETSMDGVRGALVAFDPRNGEILALVSKPDFPLEPFARRLSPDVWRRLLDDPDEPLLNRPIQAQLPPGSTYKLILASAALDGKIVNPQDRVYCSGVFMLGRRPFQCWRPEGHGSVNLLEALAGSCNVYFYELGLKTGLDAWSNHGRLFGFGRPSGIDLNGEASGLLPTRSYMDDRYGKRGWTQGMVVNLAVGQGDLLVTPLQMACLAAAVSMEGTTVRPHLVHSIRKQNSDRWDDRQIDGHRIDGVARETYRMLKEGMFRCVNTAGGTGRAARVTDLDVCGKTGTAQNPRGEPHAWFIGFAPRDKPEIAVAVVVEHGGSGGGAAAPIAGQLFRFLKKRAD